MVMAYLQHWACMVIGLLNPACAVGLVLLPAACGSTVHACLLVALAVGVMLLLCTTAGWGLGL